MALSVNLLDDDRNVMLCRPLFAWVIENLCKNAVDAMQGKGSLNVTAGYDHRTAFIEVTDTGKGTSGKLQDGVQSRIHHQEARMGDSWSDAGEAYN